MQARLRQISERFPFKRNLGLQLLTLYLLLVGPIIIGALIFNNLASARLHRDVKAADLALARAIALETNASLQNALRTVSLLALTPEVRNQELDALRPLFSTIATARSEIILVYYLDKLGIMRYHYPEGPSSTVRWDFSHRGYFTAAKQQQTALMSKGRISPTTDRPVVTAVMAIRGEQGEFQGVIGTNLALQSISRTLAEIAGDATGELRISIVDASGQIVADSSVERLLQDGAAEFPNALPVVLEGQSYSALGRSEGGREWLRSYVPIPAAGWGVIVQRPADVAFASPRDFYKGLLVAIGLFTVGGVSFWVLLAHRVIAPLEQLAGFSAAIGQRSVAPPERTDLAKYVMRSDQIGHLVRAVTRMEQDIERRFAELDTLLETSTAVVSTLDSERVLDTILEQVQRLLDVNTCAIVALDDWAEEFSIRASRGLSPSYARRLRISLTDPSSPSMRAIRSGRPVQVADIETQPNYPRRLRERARREGYRSLVAAPLVTRHAPPAALLIYSRDPHHFTGQEMNLVANFANQAAMAIENAALFALTDEKLREQTRRLEAIVQSLNDGLILEGPDGRVLYANRRICELTELAPDVVTDQTADALWARLLTHIEPGLAHRQPHRSADEIILRFKGRLLDLRVEAFDVTDERGMLIGRGQLWLDVTREKEVDRLKSALIATASHELRTPLAAIKGNLSSLLAEDVTWDEESQREFLNVALHETDRLSNLVSDLLDLSRIQAGTLEVQRELVDLSELAARATVHLPDAMLQFRLPATLPPIYVDPPRMEAVLRNLVENAIKFSPPDSPVSLMCEQSDGYLVVRVKDEGPGIPVEYREKVFEHFYRIQEGLSSFPNGAGLGLAICKGFVEAHGGRIWVEATTPGTVIAFTLPLSHCGEMND